MLMSARDNPLDKHRKAYELQITLFIVVAIIFFVVTLLFIGFDAIVGNNAVNHPYLIGISIALLASITRVIHIRKKKP